MAKHSMSSSRELYFSNETEIAFLLQIGLDCSITPPGRLANGFD